jgi:hypothetical protein
MSVLTLRDVVRVLKQYRGRYEALDAFVDDVAELSAEGLEGAMSVRSAPPLFRVPVESETLYVEVFPANGTARFRLTQPPSSGGASLGPTALGGLVGSAIGAASKSKDGLLGGLVLGILVGAAISAATGPAERTLALRFDPSTSEWRVYSGPLVRWAKRTIHPAA